MAKEEKICVYPGSFDPLTNGHLDIIKRASKLFDKVIVLVAKNSEKTSFFTTNERIGMIEEVVKDIPNVTVDSTDELTMVYAKRVGATTLVRGLRVVSDFEYEWKLAAANEYIDNSIDIVFLMANIDYSFISSTYIKEMYQNGVDVSKLVPAPVLKYFKNKK